MSAPDRHSNFLEQFAAKNGACANQNDGVYVRGQRYSFAKKLEVAAAFQLASSRARRNGKSVKPGIVAKDCGVSMYEVHG